MAWKIEDFCDEINKRLAESKQHSADNRSTNSVNPRIIRHYTSIGLLDEPKKDGKNSVYDDYHLWQALFIKKMLNDKCNTYSLKKILDEHKAGKEPKMTIKAAVELTGDSSFSDEPLWDTRPQLESSMRDDALGFISKIESGVRQMSLQSQPFSSMYSSPQTLRGISNVSSKSSESIPSKKMDSYEIHPEVFLTISSSYQPSPSEAADISNKIRNILNERTLK